jgi:transcriptional regulator with PAS, ATPase and Fis domain
MSESSEKPEIIVASAGLKAAVEQARRAARTDVNVLIYGETGTGKEVIARLIHAESPRGGGPFVPVNCGAFNDGLLASELFGHERGSFTGAYETKQGVFETASGGTVLLDEIAETSTDMQVKLLRVLQDKTVRRVGGSKEIRTDARILAATNNDLADMVRERRFREDLYYRIKVVTIHIPPLRDRPEDIVELIDHFLAHFAATTGHAEITISAQARKGLLEFRWPGNVRQLRGEIERVVSLADPGGVIEQHDLSPEITGFDAAAVSTAGDPPAIDPNESYQNLINEYSRAIVADRLVRNDNNVTQTAKSLGVSRSTLYALLKQHNLKTD